MNDSRPLFLFATSETFEQTAPALVAFENLIFYRPWAEKATDGKECPHCLFHDPLSLPPSQAENLAALLRELTARPDDFGHELLAAARNSLQATEMESSAAIRAALWDGAGLRDAGLEQAEPSAWNLWLTLLLAERQDRTEEELVRGLAALKLKEKRMLALLCGHDTNGDDDEGAGSLPASAARRAAWSRIFAAAGPFSLLLTDDRQSVELLTASHRQLTGHDPGTLPSIDLPSLSTMSELEICRRATADLRRELASSFAAASAPPPDFASRWHGALAKATTAALTRRLDCFRFEGLPASAVLTHAFVAPAPPRHLPDAEPFLVLLCR